MKYRDLREFIEELGKIDQLRRIHLPISTQFEMTALCDRVLRAEGPALFFEQPFNASTSQPTSIPVLGNLFGTTKRIALAMGAENLAGLRNIGMLLANLKEPTLPHNLKEVGQLVKMVHAIWDMSPKQINNPVCQEQIWEHQQLDLYQLPIQTCWPGDIGPLITWGLTITRGPHKRRQNLGIYRQQVISHNKTIMRWLAHRGGAQDFREHCLAYPGQPFPVAVAIGADPATILAAVTPIPDNVSEYQFAGLLRGCRTELAKCLTLGLEQLRIPARAEIILEGHILPDSQHPSGYEHALEGPFGDHTGYYNEQEYFPVFTVQRITLRNDPIYHSTYTGKPPDEPAVLGVALNEVFTPILQKQFAEIVDFYLPPEGCSYRIALVKIKKAYPGHARRVMFGVWGFLRQFMYTKFIIVLDEDIDIRNWKEVIWAITTRVDPSRDTMLLDNTPIDYLDFASPVAGLGSKMGLDATHKWAGETQREWGRPITMHADVEHRIQSIWEELNL